MSRRRQQQQLCPTPSKRIYESLDEARVDYEGQVERWGSSQACMAYHCLCLKWHRTKRDDTNLKAIDLRVPAHG